MKHIFRPSTEAAWCGQQGETVHPTPDALWPFWETPEDLCPACAGQVMEVRAKGDEIDVYIWPEGETRVLKATFYSEAQAAVYAVRSRCMLRELGSDGFYTLD